ncbi:putative zinc finger (CCCH type) protein [Leptomonas pyrrhocoris]|uniref:Putative zinc finger (CCCH type) protein n=1 Tax=Leptomonas pyrrhocoris TaxID=157538 RepID=A0A0M9FP84_LEPPY|nr:putative zinc finger (CCCH type) protein [Leptomonas pyrrhocoris]KPA73280.1 putative zinc finger (CCCH type) protein [Leptomonas pyrrhocoris]|eukprot:XP_015651719.1 putative zinc finger (CCCH type) protein [Leptomonas pyrrhocoris]
MTKNRRHDIVKPSKFKTSMCTFFISEEGCPFGDKCAFAHGDEELRAEPKESTAAAATAPPETTAATSSPASSTASEHDAEGSGPADHPNHHRPGGINKHGPQDTSGANAKRKARKNRMDAPSGAAVMGGNTHNIPGGKSAAAHARCRPQRERQTLPPPPLPMQSHGPMPSAAYNLSVAPPPPSTYALYGDLSMAYGGIPALSGMPCYIPTVGNHPFSIINNNHHAINVVPHMQSPMPYPATVPLPPTFPPRPPQPTPTPQSSTLNSPMPLNQPVHSSPRLNGNNNGGAGEESRRRLRQPTRQVVSSNTMAHSHGRHASNMTSAAPAEVASPQYVYGLMAAAGVRLNGSPTPAAATTTNSTTNATTPATAAAATATPTSDPRRSGEGPTSPSTPLHQQQQQPRLIVVPHKSGSGGFVVPSNIKNYHPQATVEPASPVPVSKEGSATPHSNSSSRAEPHSAGASSTAASGSGGAAAVAAAVSSFQQLKASPVPPTIVHIPLNSRGGDLSSAGSGKTVGDVLWGPAGGTRSSLAASTLPTADDGRGGGDYNALLSDLGIGGSSYTAIPLDELVRPRGTARDDDDVSSGVEFDWTGALERWLQAAKEESAVTTEERGAPFIAPPAKAASTTSGTPTPVAVARTSSSAAATAAATAATSTASTAYLPQASRPVTSALNCKPVLTEGETRPNAAASTEGKRKPTVICQVSRAGGRPAPPKRRAPVMTNQFKSSCAAEAESDSVLLYCAEKNTLVYITSANGKATATMAAGTNSSKTASTPSNGMSDGPAAAVEKAPSCAASPVSPTTTGTDPDLGLEVRFNPGRRKHSVLTPEASDDDAEYCI